MPPADEDQARNGVYSGRTLWRTASKLGEYRHGQLRSVGVDTMLVGCEMCRHISKIARLASLKRISKLPMALQDQAIESGSVTLFFSFLLCFYRHKATVKGLLRSRESTCSEMIN